LEHNAQLPRKVATPFDWVDRWGYRFVEVLLIREGLENKPVRALGYMIVLFIAL
jgi:hypothetical protein